MCGARWIVASGVAVVLGLAMTGCARVQAARGAGREKATGGMGTQATTRPTTRQAVGMATRPATAPRRPAVNSPEVDREGRVTFRMYAPRAQAVRLMAEDIPNKDPRALARRENGVWEVTLGPIKAGTYRYKFDVDGVVALDA